MEHLTKTPVHVTLEHLTKTPVHVTMEHLTKTPVHITMEHLTKTPVHITMEHLTKTPVHVTMEHLTKTPVHVTMEHLTKTPVHAEQIKVWTSKDPVLSKVCRYIQNGWPISTTEDELVSFKRRMDELTVQDDCIFWGSSPHRVVICCCNCTKHIPVDLG